MQLFGFLIAATFWPALSGAANASRWTMLCVAVPVGLFFVKLPPLGSPQWIVAGLLSWATLSLTWTPVLYDGIFRLAELAILAGCFLIGSATNVGAFYRGLAYGLGISSVICILQALGYEPVQIVADGAPPSGLFINPDMLGELCIVVLIGLLAYRMYPLIWMVLPALVLSQSRTAMVAGAICVLGYASLRGKWKYFLAIPLLILMVYAIAPTKWQLNPDGGGRISLWLDTIQGMTFFGHGVGSFYTTFIKFATHIDPFHYQPDTAHNDYLQFIFELGFPAAAVAAVGLSMLWWKANEPEKLVLLAYAVICFLAFPLHNPATASVFAVVAGYSTRNWHAVRRPMVRGRYSLHPWRGQAYLDRIGESVEPVSVLQRVSDRAGTISNQGP